MTYLYFNTHAPFFYPIQIACAQILFQTNAMCKSVDIPSESTGCDKDPNKKYYAEEACGVLKSDMFAACHSEVDYTVAYSNCK